MLTKKDILNARKGDLKIFLELVSKSIEQSSAYSLQDLTRIALGAAMSVVDRVPDPKRTRELLDTVRDWTRGRASDEELKRAENELCELYVAAAYTSVRAGFAAQAARAAGSAVRVAPALAARGAWAIWAISNALEAGAHPREIINSIENETGPLDWFLASRGM